MPTKHRSSLPGRAAVLTHTSKVLKGNALGDPFVRPADQVLDDDQLLTTVYEALAKRSPKSRTRGRRGTPAEVVLRLLLLKHIRNWSYEVVEREVRANLV